MNTENLIKTSLQRVKDFYAHAAKAKLYPKDTLTDAKGRHCPVGIISEIDLARNQLVNKRNQKAQELSALIEAFKSETFAEIDAFIAISNGDYQAKIGTVPKGGKPWKGNLQLINYNATQKICLKISDRIAFNEKLNNAMEKLQGLIKEHSSDIDEIIKVMVNEAFRIDQAGYIDAKKVLDLRRYNISHPVWQSAMEDINQSIQVIGSKSYLQFWYRDTPESDWQGIPLDIARL